MKRFIWSAILLCVFTGTACADGLMWIGGCGCGNPYILSGDCSGTGWSWDYDTSTLSLNSGYTGEPVFVSSYEPTTLDITG